MKSFFGLLAFLACAAGGWYVFQHAQQARASNARKGKVEVLPVSTIQAKQRTLEDRAEMVGSVEAESQVELRPRVSGYITEIFYDVGDWVDEGQVMALLDDAKLRQALKKTKSALQVAEARLKAQEASVVLARKVLDRNIELTKSGVATKHEQDQVRAELAIAEAKAELEQAHVREMESDLKEAEIALRDMEIRSPISGYVASRSLDVGDLATPTTNILTIVKLDVMKTVVHVVEKDYPQIKSGMMAEIAVDAFPDRHFAGKVLRKAPMLNKQTRTAAVYIDIPNAETLLKPGMYARVRIVINEYKDTLSLPLSAVVERNHQMGVITTSGSPPKAYWQPVEIGIQDGDFVQILRGISPQDRIITLGNRMVLDGQTVDPHDEVEREPAPKFVASENVPAADLAGKPATSAPPADSAAAGETTSNGTGSGSAGTTPSETESAPPAKADPKESQPDTSLAPSREKDAALHPAPRTSATPSDTEAGPSASTTARPLTSPPVTSSPIARSPVAKLDRSLAPQREPARVPARPATATVRHTSTRPEPLEDLHPRAADPAN